MQKEELERLKYRNQYLLAPKVVECPFLHNSYELKWNYVLYTHIDLITTIVELNNQKIVLLGDIFDFESPHKGNHDIIKDLIINDFDSILQKIGAYSGRFVLMIQEEDNLKLIHDATAARKAFYGKWDGGVWVASQPHLLASVLGIEKTNNQDKLEYYNSREFVRMYHSNIGDTTLYDEISQLIPNHLLDISNFQVKRYWPSSRIVYQPVVDVAKTCAKMIKGFMESITNRYEVMLPVTAGKDSRTLLAATKHCSEKVFYYINKEHRLKETSTDVAVPRNLLSKLGLDFHVINPYIKVDEEFEKLYFSNNHFASTEFLPLIFNYYLNFSKKVNLPGNIASAGFELFKGLKMRLTAKNFARLNRVDRFEHAKIYYDQWLSGCHDLCLKNNVNMLNLFYWEERLGNWGTQIQLEKDIAQEDINPFNSRDLTALYLSVKPKFIRPPFFKLHKRIIKILWAEVLSVPINPGRRTTLLKFFKLLGILDLYHRFKYSRFNNY